MTELRLSCYDLTRHQASLLNGLVEGLLTDFGLTGMVTLIGLNGFQYWQVEGDFETHEEEILMEALKDISLIKGARYLGSGPLAFYAARQMNITTIDYNRHCLTAQYVDKYEWKRKLSSLDDHEGLWGSPPILTDDPFSLIERFRTDHEDVTIVHWKGKHILCAEQYIQLRRRGLL